MHIPVLHPTPTRTALGAAWADFADGMIAILSYWLPRALAPAAGLIALAIRYLDRTTGRFDRLVQRWESGTLPKPRAPRPKRDRQPTDKPRLHTGKFWLVHIVQPTAQYYPRIEQLLQRPDLEALVEAAPQAARLIRPLCRAFNLAQPEWLQLPPRKPRPKPEPKPKRQKLPPGYLPGMLLTDRPLPQHVIDAVKHDKKMGRWRPV